MIKTGLVCKVCKWDDTRIFRTSESHIETYVCPHCAYSWEALYDRKEVTLSKDKQEQKDNNVTG